MFAYVKYEDKYKAILPISLVKTFSPKSDDDFDRTKKVQAFWRSDDGDIQGYYPAFVCALAGDLDTMRLKLKTMREPFPRIIDADEREEVPLRKRESEEPNGENVFVVELQKIIEKKEKENKSLKKQLREANALNGRLTRALLDKIEVARATAERQEGQVIAEFTLPSSLDAGTGLPKEMVEDVCDADMDGDATCLLPGSVVSDCSASIGIEVTHLEDYNGTFAPCDEQQQPAPAAAEPEAVALTTVPDDLYQVFGGQIKIGHNTFMPLDKWQYIMRNTKDGKFCLELARHFWPAAEAAKRSLTGQACRSISTDHVKLQATPEKVDMMKGCLQQFIENHVEPGRPAEVRLAAVRRYLSNFFTEAGRAGRRGHGTK
uniref:BEN domain-containing protein n=1 Tax=Rhipicephalus zambeziensis TaxID=60191 RepID=A0A224YR51_9ACAR